MGDLNYRIDASRAEVDDWLAADAHAELLARDQLCRVRASTDAGAAFAGYAEGPLHFRPTYKFDKGTDTYDTSPKARVPAWTDRILYRTADGDASMRLLAYKSLTTMRSSDHRPVVAHFAVALRTAARYVTRSPLLRLLLLLLVKPAHTTHCPLPPKHSRRVSSAPSGAATPLPAGGGSAATATTTTTTGGATPAAPGAGADNTGAEVVGPPSWHCWRSTRVAPAPTTTPF